MWRRRPDTATADRDILMKMVTEFGTHVEGCAQDKAEIKRRLNQQDEVGNTRHTQNTTKLNRIQVGVLCWLLITVLAVLGWSLDKLYSRVTETSALPPSPPGYIWQLAPPAAPARR